MLKKFKEFYKRNRVYSILMLISLVCIVSILVGVIVYFIGQTSKDKYGNRLDGIENVQIADEEVSKLVKEMEEIKDIKSVKYNLQGRLIYIIMEVANDTALEVSKGYANKTLSYLLK